MKELLSGGRLQAVVGRRIRRDVPIIIMRAFYQCLHLAELLFSVMAHKSALG